MREPLHIAIACFPTFGGSGVVATELALAMAERGHRVHVIARDVPVRLHLAHAAQSAHVSPVVFHEVPDTDQGVLPSNAYPIALAAKMIEVATWERIDVLHAHYAAPHATSAWMAREVLAGIAAGATNQRVPRVVATVHGTDVTAADPSHLAVTRHALLRSDAVTAPSAFLAAEARAVFGGASSGGGGGGDGGSRGGLSVDVIPNFVDSARYTPAVPARTRPHDDLVLVHVSNFRKVKRLGDVVAVFAAVCAARNGAARLLMIGDGPERSSAERRLRELGLSGRVSFLGKQETFVDELAAADVFLLPSESESFGLAALEAMSCGLPVVASDVGGLSEVVEHGVSGLLAPVGDVAAMAAHVLTLSAPATWHAFSLAARARVLARYQRAPAIDQYEALYRRVLS